MCSVHTTNMHFLLRLIAMARMQITPTQNARKLCFQVNMDMRAL